MKLGGQIIKGPNIETVIIPRGSGEPLVFKAQAVLDYTEFDAVVSMPKPRTKMLKGGKKVLDSEAPDYREAIKRYNTLRFSWMVIESLKATPDLEWEKVDPKDPSTWDQVEIELNEAGFSFAEIHYILQGVLAANAMSEEKLDKAREAFLASLREQSDLSSSQEDGAEITQSGEPANA